MRPTSRTRRRTHLSRRLHSQPPRQMLARVAAKALGSLVRNAVKFEIVGKIEEQETFATGNAIREIARLRRIYGKGRWRKRKGFAQYSLR